MTDVIHEDLQQMFNLWVRYIEQRYSGGAGPGLGHLLQVAATLTLAEVQVIKERIEHDNNRSVTTVQ